MVKAKSEVVDFVVEHIENQVHECNKQFKRSPFLFDMYATAIRAAKVRYPRAKMPEHNTIAKQFKPTVGGYKYVGYTLKGGYVNVQKIKENIYSQMEGILKELAKLQ